MLEVEKHVQIAAPIEKVWAALTDPGSIRGWMGEDSTIAVDLRFLILKSETATTRGGMSIFWGR